MSSKKEHIKMSKVKVIEKGDNPDCVHHEIISMKNNGDELGICQRCGQQRLYIPAYQREQRRYAETT